MQHIYANDVQLFSGAFQVVEVKQSLQKSQSAHRSLIILV